MTAAWNLPHIWHLPITEAHSSAPPLGRCTPQHHPQIKALRFSGLLDLSRVNQLRVQKSWGMACFPRALVVDVGASVCASYELAKPFCAGEPDPFRFREASCDIRVRATEQVRQKRQRVSFVGCRIELQLVGKIHGCHIPIVPEKQGPRNRAQTRSRRPYPLNGALRLRLAPLWKPALALASHAGF